MVLLGFGDWSVVGRVEGDDVDRVADVALDVIACAVGVAYLLPAYSADEEAKFGLCLVQFLAATAIVLVGIAWNLLLDLTGLAVYMSI